MKRLCVSGCFFILLVFSTKCTKEYSYVGDHSVDTFTTYVIPVNEQFSLQNYYRTTDASSLKFEVIFDSSCIYKTLDPLNQYDINKLYGFSDCDSAHLINSARIGWRWSDDSLRLFAFVHYNGQILSKEMTTASIGSIISCSIICDTNIYKFQVNDSCTEIHRFCNGGKYRHYYLYPYFGGDEKAPHEVVIKIREL
ncbi:hypothetical protein QTN47_26850 [Danxiaibacter flavus]|uniref:Lipoprotein n=1 Tax=Danxiaibacter flavus TaxID=3049108 RepID=A0ABV3ZMP0_9BACT|nr:hypothetical protein QNM32_26850 [Chitinophagaceae bacterium DXS]